MHDANLHEYLKLYGKHTIAFSSVFDSMLKSYYLPDKGYVMYKLHNNIRFMLGDPLCSKENLKEVVKAFIADTNNGSNTLIGVQCSLDTAKAFNKHGFSVNSMGVETILKLDTFDTKGKAMSKVRRWINSAVNAGIEVKEGNILDSSIRKELEEISNQWLNNKANTAELSLLIRPMTFNEEPGIRFFCGYLNGRMIGFNSFEPMYDRNKVIGYYANICRLLPEAPNGTLDFIMQKAREKFKNEGVKYFSFGLSPMADIQDDKQLRNPIVSFLFESSYKYGCSLYSFQGLDFHKKAYHDSINSMRQQSYMVIKGSLPINQLINYLSCIGILPEKGFIYNLSYYAETIFKGFCEEHKELFKIPEPDFKTAVSGMLNGLSSNEIAEDINCSRAFVDSLANAFTSMWKKKLPEFQEQLYIQRDFNDISKDIFAKIERIVDADTDVAFLYNIGIHPVGKGHFIMMTIEINGKLTITKANFIVARIKEAIKKKIPSVAGVLIETAPLGQYAFKIGQDNGAKTNFTV